MSGLLNNWQLEISCGRNIYTTEIGKCDKSSLCCCFVFQSTILPVHHCLDLYQTILKLNELLKHLSNEDRVQNLAYPNSIPGSVRYQLCDCEQDIHPLQASVFLPIK